MRGLDYRWLEALDAVITIGSFEGAAQALHITQSAVSQRVKQLERFMAQPMLIRAQPPSATVYGQQMLGLYQRVRLLEQELIPEIIDQESNQAPNISIATNADSLATWLLPALKPLLTARKFTLNLVVEDESRTIDKLKYGEVLGAISMESNPLKGCQADYLGRVDFVAVANPEFVSEYFENGVDIEAIKRAPSAVFDPHDEIHASFLAQHFQLSMADLATHTLRSSDAFVTAALLGIAYCVVPWVQVKQEVEQGRLVNILPELRYSRDLYWHHWSLESGVMADISRDLLDYSKQVLPQQ